MNWNVCLDRVEGDKILPKENPPEDGGEYLCTCVENNGHKFLRILCYDRKRNLWHDLGNKNGLSYNILAWTNSVKPCEFEGFTIHAG